MLGRQATTLAVTNGKVYVGGSFTSAGGDSMASRLASSALRQPDVAVGGVVPPLAAVYVALAVCHAPLMYEESCT